MDEDLILELAIDIEADPRKVEEALRKLQAQTKASNAARKVGENIADGVDEGTTRKIRDLAKKILRNAIPSAQQAGSEGRKVGASIGAGMAQGLSAGQQASLRILSSTLKKVEVEVDHTNRRITQKQNAALRDNSSRLTAELKRAATIGRQGTTAGQVGVDRLRAGNEQVLSQQRAHNARLLAQEQQAGARRTALYRTVLNNITRINQTGMTFLLSAWRGHQNRRTADEQSANKRAEIELQGSMDRRLAIIRRATKTERSVAAASASERANNVLGGGVLGAATGRGVGGLAGLLGGGLITRRIFGTLADFQQVETAFKGIFNEVSGKAPRTEAFLDKIQEFARETPFSFQQVAEAGQKLFTNRVVDPKAIDATEQLTKRLNALSNAASATGKNAAQVDAALLGITQIGSTGQLMMEELRQVTENIGLPIEEVAKVLGLSVADMKEQMKKGAIDATTGLNAIFTAMERIPGAAGASARQAKTLRGAMSNLSDSIDQAIRQAFLPLAPLLASTVSGFASLVRNLVEGKGVYAVVRVGLAGIAVSLGALAALKGAAQVLQLVKIGVVALAGSPVLLAATALGLLGATLFKLYQGNSKVKAFFDSLVTGTKNWIEVGFLLEKPITDMGKMVLIQSSLGVTLRAVRNFVRGMQSAVKELFSTKDLSAFRTRLEVLIRSIPAELAPLKDAFSEGFGSAFDQGLRLFQQRRVGIGVVAAVLLRIFGKGGGVTTRLAAVLASIVAGAVSTMDLSNASRPLAAKIGEVVDRAKVVLGDIKLVGLDFFSGLAGQDVSTPAGELAAYFRAVVSTALAGVGNVAAIVSEFLGSRLAGLGEWIISRVVPQLIELPRILGRTISKVLFSEEFLKGFSLAAGALGILAVGIAAQFVRGFVEGIIARRGDIANVLRDAVLFAIRTLAGAGNPFLVIAGLLIAAFAGSKIVGVFNGLRTSYRKVVIGMTQDTASARASLVDLNKEALGTGSRLADMGAKLRSGLNRGGSLVRTVGRSISDMGDRIASVAPKAGALAVPLTNVSTIARRMGDAVAGSTARIKSVVSSLSSSFNIAGAAAASAAGLVIGKFTAMADTAQARAVGVISAVGGVAAAFAEGGPVIGSIAIVSTTIGLLWGAAEKRAEEARKRMEETAARSKETAQTFLSAFKTAGSAGPEARGAAILDVLNKQIEDSAVRFDVLSRKYGISAKRIRTAAIEGPGALRAELERVDKQFRSNIRNDFDLSVIAGIPKAAKAGVDSMVDLTNTSSAFLGVLRDPTAQAKFYQLSGAIQDGSISIEEMRGKLRDLGFSTKQVDQLVDAFRRGAAAGADLRDLDIFSDALISGVQDAVDQFEAMEQVQRLVRYENEKGMTVADRYSAAWDRLKDRIDKAKNAYQGYIDAVTGKGTTEAQATLDILAAARESKEGRRTGETQAEADARAVLNQAQAQSALGGIVAQISKDVRESGGSVDDARKKVDEFLTRLREGAAGDGEMQAFIDKLRKSGEVAGGIEQAFGSAEPIKNIAELRERFLDFIQEVDRRPALVAIQEAPNFQERKRLIFMQLVELSKDKTISAYIQKAGGYEAVLNEILADKGEVVTPATIPVIFQTPPKTEAQKKLDELKRELNFTIPVELKLVPPTRREKGGPGAAFQPLVGPTTDSGPNWTDLGGGSLGRVLTEAERDEQARKEAKEAVAALVDAIRKRLGMTKIDWFEALFENDSVAGGAVGTASKVYEKLGLSIVTSNLGTNMAKAIDSALHPRTLDVYFNLIPTQISAAFNSIISGVRGFTQNYDGGYIQNPVISSLAERGPEAVFPLTNPARMRAVLGIPQVRQAFEAIGATMPGSSPQGNYAPVSVDQSQVNNFTILESSSPRETASQVVRRQRSARFLGGHTLPVGIR